ncbi:MAG: hypothetical protein O3C43_18075 [Verrucomicrobia bacterium]|nr:hypothetical protein [Verrucomicrobiota bacterium]MDA1068399.1 hypothetical protein [Verrucomicrobiota bacterium]
MKHYIWGLLLITSNMPGADLVWDDEGKIFGVDSDRWNIKENWSGDRLPTAGDNVSILSKGPVELFNNSAEVNTILCKVPLNLGDTLTVGSSGTFENSIIAGALGRIRANGPVTFEGNNSLNTTTLDGNSKFINKGTLTFGTRGIAFATIFENEGVFSLVSGNTNLGLFKNKLGAFFNFGAKGNVGSSTIFTNEGTMRKDNPEEDAQFLGDFIQKGLGILEIGTGAQLTLGGATTEISGDIKVDGTLIINQITGRSPNHSFKDLFGIKGNGTIQQLVRPCSKSLPEGRFSFFWFVVQA